MLARLTSARRPLTLILGALVLGGLVTGATLVLRSETPVPAEPDEGYAVAIYALAGPGWRVSEQYTAPGVLVAMIETERLDDIPGIARTVVERIPDAHDEILMYFHLPGATDTAAARARWTPAGGYELLRFR